MIDALGAILVIVLAAAVPFTVLIVALNVISW